MNRLGEGRRKAAMPPGWADRRTRRHRHHARPILYLEDLTVQFDGFRALNKLSLSIDAASCAA
jgi:hypothetical protein